MGDTTLRLMHEFKRITHVGPRFDGIISAILGKHIVDTFKLDEDLAANDEDYDNVKCTYKGKPNYSMEMYLQEKFGDTAVSIVEHFNNDLKVDKK